jgi:penicillin-binding protein 2
MIARPIRLFWGGLEDVPMSSDHPRVHFTASLFLVLVILLTACAPVNQATPQPTARIRRADAAAAAAAQAVVVDFLQAWEAEDYPAMYGSLSALSQDAMPLDEFIATYQEVATTLTLQSVQGDVLSALGDESYAEVAYRVDFETRLAGVLRREIVAALVREADGWRIQWEIGLIMPELRDGGWLKFVHQLPSRGRLFDRAGAPLAAYESAIAIGLVPGEMRAEQAEQVYQTLAQISFYEPAALARQVESTPADWYLPVVSLTQAAAAPHIEALRALSGVRITEFRSRFYVDGGVAPHALGYMLFIPEDQLEEYTRLGYQQDERIGAAGLEAAFEAELAGKHGGSLYLMNRSGEIQSLLAASDPVPGQSITTTLDKRLQMQLQASLGDQRAAVVVMEADTGRVLALVSNPHFDPNAFDLTEIDRSLLESYFSNPDQPLFNRATQGQYPLGSVFKVISMSAGLESGLYRSGSSLYCGHSMWVCDSVTLYDWTLGYGVAPSGELNLLEGLMRSCNPWFYNIGENLFVDGMDGLLSNMAFGFGLGARTGIDIPEAAGNIPEMAGTCVNSAQIAIGQGEVLVTPLQVASFFAALANGGTLYRPALVESIRPGSGEPSYVFSPELLGQLPISAETLAAVAEGLRMVVEEMRGTGYWAMEGLTVPVSGKTGTAQTPTGNSHAWFAGYSRANDPDRPDVAVAVIIENSGEGSVMAAPVFRRAISLYFSDGAEPAGVMPWEAEPYVPYQPEVEPEE